MIKRLLLVGSLALISACASAPATKPVDAQLLLRTSTAWDGSPYPDYPTASPELSLLKIRIAPDTSLDWHHHPAPSVGYLLAGELRVETRDGRKKLLRAGEALAELTGIVHRGHSGSQGAELIVFHASSPGVPLSLLAEQDEQPSPAR